MYLPVCRREIEHDDFIQAWINFCGTHFGTINEDQALEFNMPLMHVQRSMDYVLENGYIGLDMLLRELSGDSNRKQVTAELFALNEHILLRTQDAISPRSGRQVGGARLILNQ